MQSQGNTSSDSYYSKQIELEYTEVSGFKRTSILTMVILTRLWKDLTLKELFK